MIEAKMDADRRGMRIGGIIVLGIGVIFLLSNLGFIPDIDEMWPLFPIVVGIALIVGSFRKGKEPERSGSEPT